LLLSASLSKKFTPQVNLVTQNRKFNALLDTGASHCFINHKAAVNLKIPILMKSIPPVMIGNAAEIQPLGSCIIPFRIGKENFEFEFFVLKSLPFSFILGSDFIRYSKLIPDLDSAKFWFKGKKNSKLTFANREILCALQGLTINQEQELEAILSEFPEVLCDRIGKTVGVQCKLKVDDSKPIAQKPYPVSKFKRELIDKHVKDMLNLGIIRPSDSEWASPVNMVKEADNSHRFTLDFRQVNKKSASDPYVIPRMDSLLHRLGEAAFISKIDLKKGYWQIAMHPDSIKYTAFICDSGKFEFLRMPFGLKTAQSVFQRLMNSVLGDMRGIFADAYVDDIIIYSNSWTEHLEHIKAVIGKLRKAGFTVNQKKCEFGKTTLKYLGFVIKPEGIITNPEKTSAVMQYPKPRTSKDVKKFLGFCGWYRHFIPNFSEISVPLTNLMKKDIKFGWNDIQQQAFDKLKDLIVNTVTLAFPDFTKRFILRTDASIYALGCVLAQKTIDGRERPIAFASRALSKVEQSYHPCEKECLGIVWALKKFEQYLDGVEFDLETDNRALVWLDKMRDLNSKFMRWSLKIQDFQAIIKHIPGRLNVVADCLSRFQTNPSEPEEDKIVVDPFTAFPKATVNFLLTLTSDITLESLQVAQSEDPEVQALLTDLPPSLEVKDNILFKVNPQGGFIPFIPKNLRQSILSYFHDSPHAGHLGYRKTMQRLLRRVFWFGLHNDLYTYIRSCHTCQQVKNPNTKPHGDLQSQVSQGPWETLAIDFMGPLPVTRRKNTQLLVVVDHFTKWVELFALPDSKADRVCKVLENEIFCRWGAPKYILSDNATNFRGKYLAKLCKTWNTKHKYTSTYHPQSNIAERVNRNIRAILSSYIAEKHTKWDEYLATTAFALRTAVSDTTGFSPSFLNLGRELNLPFDRNLSHDANEFASRKEYNIELITKLQNAYSKALKAIQKSHISQAKYYNEKHKPMTFKVDDLVLLKSHYLSDKSKRFTKKFAYRWTGPYKVTRLVSPVTYELEIEDSNFVVHNIRNLKMYFDRPSDMDSFEQDFVPNNINLSSSNTNLDQESSEETPTINLRSRVIVKP